MGIGATASADARYHKTHAVEYVVSGRDNSVATGEAVAEDRVQKRYEVRGLGTNEVTLTIAMGQGDAGGTTVFLDGLEIARVPGTGTCVLGVERELGGRTASVYTDVRRTGASRRRLVTYTIDGGPRHEVLTRTDEAGTVVFETTIEFVVV